MKIQKRLNFTSCLGLHKPDRLYHENDGFFSEGAGGAGEAQAPIEPEKIKVGEKEYTQDELQKIVGLGEIGLESEKQFKTSIKNVWPNYQKVINEKRELEQRFNQTEEQRKQYEARVKEFEAKQPIQPTQQQPQFTPEQIREAALKQAEELGIGPQAIRKTVMEVIQGQNLISDISSSIDAAVEEGWIKDSEKATVETVLNHMQTEGIKNPTKALKDMFEEDYLQAQAEKIAKLKEERLGMPTLQGSIAGSKQPAPTSFKRMKDDALAAMVNEALQEVAR